MTNRKVKVIEKGFTCSKCDTRLDGEQLYCYECGEPSRVLKEEFSAFNNIKETWSDFKKRKGEYYPFALFYFFVLLVPFALIINYTRGNYWLHNVSLLLFLPLLFVPFSVSVWQEKERLTIGRYLSSLKIYFRYFVFILINIVYFALLKLITTSVDPILNLVRLIMVLYWIAIVTPYAPMISFHDASALKGLLLLYRGGKETRWQQFYTALFLVIINALGLLFAGVGLLVTIPFSIAVIERYYRQMEKYSLLKG